MKAIIFAGGVGTRLWPLSRKSSPKQFEKVIGEKSTLQLASERLLPDIDWQDIYIATNKEYSSLVSKQLPQISTKNIIGEPVNRDVGPAVLLAMSILAKSDASSPVVILWSDHIVKNIDLFKKVIFEAEKVIKKDKYKIVFISQKPRFASQNLGWIHFGDRVSRSKLFDFYEFEDFYYRPDIEKASKFFRSPNYAWNIGYFVSTPKYLLSLYKKYMPQMYDSVLKITRHYQTKRFETMLSKVYSTLEKISFDNAVLEKMDKEQALVAVQDLGWSDVGAWEALKEALQESKENNVVHGKVIVNDSRDSLIYNYGKQLIVAIDLDGLLVVNTNDVVLVCHKNSVPKIKSLVEKLGDTENSHLI